MPPHCDALDGPVVAGARAALELGDVELALRFVPADADTEVRMTFERAQRARGEGPAAREVADRWFFETLVRVHRAGEGAPFTGLKPAGLDHGPVLPVAEQAIQTGSADALIRLLTEAVAGEAKRQLDRVLALRTRTGEGLAAARAATQAELGLQVWANTLWRSARADPHQAHRQLEHEEA
jgi:hypothetical protein